MPRLVNISIVQQGAVHLNLSASLERLKTIVQQAADQQVKLLVFGEGWLSGYPGVWFDHVPEAALWNHTSTKRVFQRFYENSITVDGDELRAIREQAREHQIVICLGFNEKVRGQAGHGTLYNSLVIIDADGQIRNHHRKLVPTYTERLVHGPGDARGLRAVSTAVGRVGALICWEHWMPLTRQALHQAHEEIHIALWPTVHEMHQVASRHYAFEGRCFVVAAGQRMTADELPDEFDRSAVKETQLLRGGSCVVAPDGRYVLAPDTNGRDLLTVEIDLDETIGEKMTLDVTGHYQRDDIFDFRVKDVRDT